MKDRQGSLWTPRLLVPLVVGLQVGLFWLAMRAWNSPTPLDAPAPPVHSDSVGEPAAEPGAAPADRAGRTPGWLAAGQQPPRWLPLLTDRTRTLLTSFQSLPEEAGVSPAQSGPEGEEAPPPRTGWPHDAGQPPATLPADTGPEPAAEVIAGPALSLEDAAPSKVTGEDPRPVGPERTEVASQAAAPAEPQRILVAPQAAVPMARAAESRGEAVSQPAEKLGRPWEPSGRRSAELEMIARQADVHTRRAFELAGRGAYFSARSEFIMALRLLAQGLDTDGRTDVHSRALALGLRALREAEDFAPRGSRLEADLNMPGIIAGHRTPVLKDYPAEEITPLAALQRYFTFAQEQLAIAAGQEVAGSMALQGLGKLHAALADHRTSGVKGAEPKAVVFYQAALLVYPMNHMASNDLGVLLARAGHYGEARMALVYSLSIRPHAVGWRNLAVVYRQCGQMDLALRAAQQWQVHRKAEIAGNGGAAAESSRMVRWVTPETLARSYAPIPDEPRSTPAAGPAAASPSRVRNGPAARQAANRAWPAGPSNHRN